GCVLAGTLHGLVGLGEVCASLASRRNVLSSCLLQNVLRALGPLRVVRVYRQQDAATFHAPFIALCLILRDAHANQGSRDAADRAPNSRSSQSSHDRTSRDERPESGNGERANSGQPAKSAAEQSSRTCSGRSTFRGL